jgi:hypothetical protein
LRSEGTGVRFPRVDAVLAIAGREPATSISRKAVETAKRDGRKVRAPKSTMPGNARSRDREGKCNREETTCLVWKQRAAGQGETAG